MNKLNEGVPTGIVSGSGNGSSVTSGSCVEIIGTMRELTPSSSVSWSSLIISSAISTGTIRLDFSTGVINEETPSVTILIGSAGAILSIASSSPSV